MKLFLLAVARLLLVAVYSVSVGLLAGFIWMKIEQYMDKQRMRAWQVRQAA